MERRTLGRTGLEVGVLGRADRKERLAHLALAEDVELMK